MPTVPTYNGPQVQQRGLSNVRLTEAAPIEAFGGGNQQVAQATDRALGAANDVFLEQKRRADQIRVEQAENDFIMRQNEMIYGSQNPESNERGLASRKGADAFGVPDEYIPKFDKAASELEESLSNDSQKRAFRERLAKRRVMFNEQINKHVYSEQMAYEEATTKAGIDVSRDDAVKNYSDPVIVKEALERQKNLILTMAQSKGFKPEDDATKNMLTENLSKTHTQIIGQMLEVGDDEKAGEYFKNITSELTGEDHTRVKAAIEAGNLRTKSMRGADEILSKYSGSMPQALAEVRKIEDPKLRDETMRRVKEGFQEREQANNYQKEKVFESSYDKIRLSNGNLDVVSPQAWTYMDAAQVERLKDYAGKIKSGEGIKTDPATYYELYTRASTPELRDKFKQENLLNYVNKLSPTDFQEMVKLQNSLRKEDPAELSGFRTKEMIVKQTLSGVGIDPTPKEGTSKAEVVGQFYRNLDAEVIAFEKEKGKKPTVEDIQKMADKLVMEVEVEEKGLFGDLFGHTDTKKRFQLEVTDRVVPVMVTKVEKLAPYEKDAIVKQLKARNIKVTNENILQVYNSSIKKEIEKRKKK